MMGITRWGKLKGAACVAMAAWIVTSAVVQARGISVTFQEKEKGKKSLLSRAPASLLLAPPERAPWYLMPRVEPTDKVLRSVDRPISFELRTTAPGAWKRWIYPHDLTP